MYTNAPCKHAEHADAHGFTGMASCASAFLLGAALAWVLARISALQSCSLSSPAGWPAPLPDNAVDAASALLCIGNTALLIHSFNDPLIHSLAHDPFPHSFIHPSTHLFIHAFIRSFVRSFIHSCGFTKVHIYMYCMLCVIVMRYMVFTCAVTVSQWCMMASRVQNMSRHSVSDCT